jgi:hypothetical protein
MLEPSDMLTNTCFERFVWGFIFGAFLTFIGVLFEGIGSLSEAFIAALVVGAIVGALGAAFGRRVLHFLIELLANLL